MPHSPFSSSTPASASTFDGIPAPDTTQAGIYSRGDVAVSAGLNYVSTFPEGVPAPVNVQLAGTGITKIGSPQQYSVRLSLSGTSTVQINASMANSQNAPVSAVGPNVFAYQYVSRNVEVATVSSTGLVTAVGRGECEILIISPRAANASFPGATPSGTEGVQGSLQVTVLR